VRVKIPKRALMTYPFVLKTKTKPVALTCVTSVWVALNFSFAFKVYIRLSESWKLFTWDKNLIKSISLGMISWCFVLDNFSSKVVRSPFGHNRLLLSKLLNRTGPAPFFFGLEVQTKVLNKIVNNGLHLLDPSHSSLVLNKVHTNSRQSCRCSPVMYDPQDITL